MNTIFQPIVSHFHPFFPIASFCLVFFTRIQISFLFQFPWRFSFARGLEPAIEYLHDTHRVFFSVLSLLSSFLFRNNEKSIMKKTRKKNRGFFFFFRYTADGKI